MGDADIPNSSMIVLANSTPFLKFALPTVAELSNTNTKSRPPAPEDKPARAKLSVVVQLSLSMKCSRRLSATLFKPLKGSMNNRSVVKDTFAILFDTYRIYDFLSYFMDKWIGNWMYEFPKHFFVNLPLAILLSLKCKNEDHVSSMITCDFLVALGSYKHRIPANIQSTILR